MGEVSSTSSPNHRRLEVPQALLAAWVIVAVINAGVILFEGKPGTRLEAYLYAFGHLLALGLLSFGVTYALRRWGPKRALWPFLALTLLALALAFAVLPPDFSNFVMRQEEAGSKLPWDAIGPTATAFATVAAVWVGRMLAGRSWRWLLAPIGLAAAVLGQIGLLTDYPGVRLFAVWNAANLLAAALLGTKLWLPSFLSGPRVSRVALAACALLSLATLAFQPRPSVRRTLTRSPGSVLAPHLRLVRAQLASDPISAGSYAQSEWFRPRDKMPSIPASKPALLPKDALVIFITIDATRGDLFVGEKYRSQLPDMLELRDAGLHFEMARAPSPATVTSIAAMFSGRYYSQIFWFKPQPHIHTADKEPTPFLAELLSQSGVRTVGVVNALSASKRGGSRGFQRQVFTKRSFAPAAQAMDLMLKELRTDASGPLFMYMHLIEPHAPYKSGGKHGSKFKNYVAEVGVVDKQVGRLRQLLKERGLEDRTSIIISADHGEAFGEHGEFTHSFGNYDEVVHVPLIFSVPGVKPRVVKDPVSVMDVRPTILELFGLPTPGTDMGQSLVPYLRGESPKLTRPLVVDAGRRIQAMVFPNNIKVIRNLKTSDVEIYDLNKDPGEQHDLMDEEDFDPKAYENALAAFFEVHTLKRNNYEIPWQKF